MDELTHVLRDAAGSVPPLDFEDVGRERLRRVRRTRRLGVAGLALAALLVLSAVAGARSGGPDADSVDLVGLPDEEVDDRPFPVPSTTTSEPPRPSSTRPTSTTTSTTSVSPTTSSVPPPTSVVTPETTPAPPTTTAPRPVPTTAPVPPAPVTPPPTATTVPAPTTTGPCPAPGSGMQVQTMSHEVTPGPGDGEVTWHLLVRGRTTNATGAAIVPQFSAVVTHVVGGANERTTAVPPQSGQVIEPGASLDWSVEVDVVSSSQPMIGLGLSSYRYAADHYDHCLS